MKISRIDVIGQNGNDGAAYDGFGAEWLIQSGLIASSGESTDQRGQASLPDPVEGARSQGAGEAEAGERSVGGCSGECAACRCGGAEGEGE